VAAPATREPRAPARTPEEIRERREAKLEALRQRMEQAVEELVSGEDWLRAMEFAARLRARSFANTLLILLQHNEAHEEGRVPEPFPTYVAGFKQWQELGRSVVKGQSGYMIWSPVKARFASRDPSNKGSWRRLSYREQPTPGETVRTKMVGVKPAYVWDISQTDGEPIPQRPRPTLLKGHAPAGLWDALADQVREYGFDLLNVPDAAALNGGNGSTNFDTRTVSVRLDIDDAARVKTLAHELAHIVLGHGDEEAEGLHRGIGEVEAESVAAMVTTAFGMDTAGYSVPYVASWSTKVDDQDPAEVVRTVGETVRKAALAILDQLPDPPLDDGTPLGLQHDERHGAEQESSVRRQAGAVAPSEPSPAARTPRPQAGVDLQA
jgi:hypothetical protein